MLKKISALCMMVLLICQMTGCIMIPSYEKIALRYDVSEIVSVELYDLRENGYHGMSSAENISQMEQDLTPIGILESEQYDVFVSELESITFSDVFVIVLAAMDPAYSYHGYTVKIDYQNGEYDILSPTGQLYYYGDGKGFRERSYSCDEDVWNDFIESYFTEE